FSSLHQFDGPYRGRHIDSKGWFNWFNQDYVGQYEIGGKKVYAVSDTQNLVVKKDFSGAVDSWTRVDVDKADQGSGAGDWTMYMFNNTNNLIGESPTYCQIKAIAEGKPVVQLLSSTGVMTHPPITNCDQVDPGHTKKMIASFKDGNNKTVSVTSPKLKASAQHIMALGPIVDQGQKAKFTVQDARDLLSSTRYKAALAEMTPQFLSSKPHDILK
ncbi:porin, partial [Vibrio sp. 10N.261.49.A5]